MAAATRLGNTSAQDARSCGLRFLLACVLFAGIIAAQWPSGPPPDFQVWVAADAVATSGGNPYDIDELNSELRANPAYGSTWQESPERFVMRFFNPPMWLTILRAVAFSPLLMTGVGVVCLSAAMALLGAKADDKVFASYVLGAALVLLSPMSTSTVSYGQTGLFLAGVLGLRIVAIDRFAEGVPLAVLSFKPHIALAAATPALVRDPVALLRRLTAPALVVMVATVVLYGVPLTREWVSDLFAGGHSLVPFDDLTLRTLSPRWPLPASWSFIGIALAIAVGAWAGRRTTADPSVLALFATGLTIFLSGHGFAHDWLWIVLIPVVCGWSFVRSVGVSITVVAVYLVNYNIDDVTRLPIVSSPSIVALLVVVYLGYEVFRSNNEVEVAPDRATEPAPV